MLCTSILLLIASPEKIMMNLQVTLKIDFLILHLSDYKNGVYSIDKSAREQWESMEEFPPYELNVDRGEELFNMPFKMVILTHALKTRA